MLIEQRIQGHPALIRVILPSEEWIEFLIDLLVRTRPAWALETAVRMAEGQSQLVLDLTGLSSLDTVDYPDHYTSDQGHKRLLALVRSLLDAQDALVEPEQIKLEAEHIFIEPETGSARLAIIPVLKPVIQPVLKQPESALHAGYSFNSSASQSFFAQGFMQLLTSMQKAYSLDASLVDRLNLLAKDNDLEKIHLELLQTSPDRPPISHQEIEPATEIRRQTKFFHEKKGNSPCGSNTQPGARNWYFRILIAGHLLIAFALIIRIGLQVITEFKMVSPMMVDQLPLNLAYRVIGLTATLLLFTDLIATGLFSSLKRVLSASLKKIRISAAAIFTGFKASVRKTDKSNRPQVESTDQTVLLSPVHDAYRLGLLSVGLPGSPEESEGLRAYILVDEFLIGRDETVCDLPLPVASIGRKHARIRRREGSFFVSDLGSKNGTSLDGRRLNKMEEYLLPDRCRLEFADQAFYFSAD